MVCRTAYETPLGTVTIGHENGRVLSLCFAAESIGTDAPSPVSDLAARQLKEYFAGKRRSFDFPISVRGTPFQEAVWAALQEIPYGQTRTYGQLAAALGRPGACRAVGNACNRNPLLIVIPCHRVVGRRGSLTGYAAGLATKEFLLNLEQRCQ